MIKKLLLLLLLTVFKIGAFAQVKDYYNPINSTKLPRLIAEKTLFFPTGCGVPSGTSLNSDTSNRAALYHDSCGNKTYIYDPSVKTWSVIFIPQITMLITDQVLKYNGSAWVNWTPVFTMSTVTGLTDSLLNKVSRDGSYFDPLWISSLAWAKITSTPTTKAGYNITDVPAYADSTSWLAGRWLPNRSSDTAAALQARIQTKQPLGSYLVAGNNLADVTNITTARINLGLANGALFDTSTIQPRFDLKETSIAGGTTAQYWRGDKSWQTLNSAAVGLGNVDNKSSITIRSEITYSNVTSALAFTPENIANKGIANGYADLDALGKIPASRIDFGQTGQTFVVASQAAMLAVSNANIGALAIRTDSSLNFRLIAQPASVYTNWQVLLSPDAPVQSVNGFTGNVNLLTTHISEGSNYYWTAARSRAGQSITTTGSSGAATYDNTTGVWNIPVYQAAGTYLTNFSFTNSTGITGTVTNPTTTPALSLAIDSAAIANFHIKVRSLFTAGAGINISNGTVASTITQYTDALARSALSFAAGSGAYNSSTGVITIPTDNSQITNSAGYITAAQTYYVGTTLNALNRASAAQTLTGVNIDGTASNVTGIVAVVNGGTGSSTGETLATVTARGSSTSTVINFNANPFINNTSQALLLLNFTGVTAWQASVSAYNNIFNIYDETAARSIMNYTRSTNTVSFGANSITAGAISGTTGTFTGGLTASQSVNAGFENYFNNGNIGTAAYSQIGLGNGNGNSVGIIRVLGSAFTTSAYNEQDALAIISSRQSLNIVAANNKDIKFWDGITNSVIFKTGGNVGIGTASPNDKLDVFSTIRSSVNTIYYSQLGYTGGTIVSMTSPSTEISDNMQFIVNGGSTSTAGNAFVFKTQTGNTTPSEVLRIGKTGASTFSNSVTAANTIQSNTTNTNFVANATTIGLFGHIAGQRSGVTKYYLGIDASDNFSVLNANATSAFTISTSNNSGDATFSSNITASNSVTVISSDGSGKTLKFTGGITTYNAMIAVQNNYSNTLEITASSAVGTSVFNRNIAKFNLSDLSATFASSVSFASSSSIPIVGIANNADGLLIMSGATNGVRINNAANSAQLFKITDAGVTTFSGSVTASSFIKSGGTSNQFLKADGSVDANDYLLTSSINQGTTNYVAKYAASLTIVNSQIYDNGTNVTINKGTPTANTRFQIRGSSAYSSNTNFTLSTEDANGIVGFAVDDAGSISSKGVSAAYTAVTATYTILSYDYMVVATAGSNYTITLPTAIGIRGKIYVIKNNGATNPTLGTTSSQTIDGATTKSLATIYSTYMVQSDGANWNVITFF